MDCRTHHVKFDMWTAFFYVNYLSCSQQWNESCNFTIIFPQFMNDGEFVNYFPNSSIDPRLGFSERWSYFYVFDNSQRDFVSQFIEKIQRGRLNLWINCQFLRKGNAHIYITTLCLFNCWKCKMFWGNDSP